MPLPSRQTHTSTQEWQSFEIRMRRRRAERCLLRAEVALDAGFEDEARNALEEARRLDWQSPDFETLKARLEARRAAAAAQLAVRRRRTYMATGVIAVALTAGGYLLSTGDQQSAGAATAANTPVSPVPPAAMELPPAQAPADPPAASPDIQAPTTGTAGDDRQSETPAKPEPSRERPEPVETTGRAAKPSPTVTEPPPTSREAATTTERIIPPPPVQTAVAAAAPETQAPATVLGRSEPRAFTPPPAARVPELPLASVPPPPESRPAPEPAPPADAGVRAALAQYESAYSSLDAQAARAVWPSVDADKLQRAFEGLESQRFSLGRCEIAMNGSRARATCQGNATWTPKVGAGGTRTAARRWNFDLENSGGTWRITRADAR